MFHEIILAIAAFFGAVSGLVTWFLTKDRRQAEIEEKQARKKALLTEASENVLDMALKQLERLERDVKQLNVRIEEYRHQLDKAMEKEQSLIMQVGKLRKRVGVLEEYIVEHNLDVPRVETTD